MEVLVTRRCLRTPHEGMWGTGFTVPFIVKPRLDGSERTTTGPGCFISTKLNPVLIQLEAGWSPESVWALWTKEKSNGPPENRSI